MRKLKNCQAIESTIGPHGSASITSNSVEQFTLLWRLNDITLGNIFFQHKDLNKITRFSPKHLIKKGIDYTSIGL